LLKNKQKLRLLNDGIKDPFMHFAVEDAVLRLVDEEKSPSTLRIRQTIPSVWIGVFQHPEENVNIEYCTEHNIPIVRRSNPGGAVYQDSGSLCYSMFFNRNEMFSHLGIEDPSQLYSLTGKAVLAVCKDFGVKAKLSPVNDITVDNRKIYGSAQLELYSAFVHSGTFLVNADIKTMQNCLKPSDLKFKEKGFKSVAERVINLSEAARKAISVKHVIKSLINHFSEILNIELQQSPLTKEEKTLAEKLLASKYSKKEWTFRKKQLFTTKLSTKIKSGVVNLHISTDNQYIKNIHITGDFLLSDPEILHKIETNIRGLTIEKGISFIKKSPLPQELKIAVCHMITNITEGQNRNE